MAVSVQYNGLLNVQETIALSEDLVGTDPTVVEEIDTYGTLTASTTVPVTKAWGDERTLSSGTDTFDLTALVNAAHDNIDMTGLKVQFIKVLALSTNTEAITVEPGDADPYEIFGSAAGKVDLVAGAWTLCYFADGNEDVASDAKNIKVTSSDVDAKYQVQIVAG